VGELAVTSVSSRAEDQVWSMAAPLAADRRPASRRDAFNQWFLTHEVVWELFMAALAIVYVALGFIADDVEAAAADRPEINAAELALTAAFAVEFAARVLAARVRVGYLKGHWIDLVALVPPIRGARVLRLLRLLRLVRAFAGIYRAGMHIGGLARHRGFAWLLVAWLGVMAVCSAWMYVAEKGANELVNSPFDALWWGVVTLTTVGYGDVVPHTTEGRIAAMALMLLGIGLFGAITATITSYFLSSDLRRMESKVEADVVLNTTMEKRTAPSATEGPRLGEGTSFASGTLVSELERLAALHHSGDLTADEFERAKDQMLGRTPGASQSRVVSGNAAKREI
jgi:voltage-gated potassium channel